MCLLDPKEWRVISITLSPENSKRKKLSRHTTLHNGIKRSVLVTAHVSRNWRGKWYMSFPWARDRVHLGGRLPRSPWDRLYQKDTPWIDTGEIGSGTQRGALATRPNVLHASKPEQSIRRGKAFKWMKVLSFDIIIHFLFIDSVWKSYKNSLQFHPGVEKMVLQKRFPKMVVRRILFLYFPPTRSSLFNEQFT